MFFLALQAPANLLAICYRQVANSINPTTNLCSIDLLLSHFWMKSMTYLFTHRNRSRSQ